MTNDKLTHTKKNTCGLGGGCTSRRWGNILFWVCQKFQRPATKLKSKGSSHHMWGDFQEQQHSLVYWYVILLASQPKQSIRKNGSPKNWSQKKTEEKEIVSCALNFQSVACLLTSHSSQQRYGGGGGVVLSEHSFSLPCSSRDVSGARKKNLKRPSNQNNDLARRGLLRNQNNKRAIELLFRSPLSWECKWMETVCLLSACEQKKYESNHK